MVIWRRTPYEPVTICRVTLQERTKDSVVVMVTDKWQAPAPEKTEAKDDDDIPF